MIAECVGERPYPVNNVHSPPLVDVESDCRAAICELLTKTCPLLCLAIWPRPTQLNESDFFPKPKQWIHMPGYPFLALHTALLIPNPKSQDGLRLEF